MNGLKEDYQEQVDFRSLNAATDGEKAFQAYALPGHPGFVLLNPDGDVLWRGFGEQPAENISTALDTALQGQGEGK